jgi:hypothetical protein
MQVLQHLLRRGCRHKASLRVCLGQSLVALLVPWVDPRLLVLNGFRTGAELPKRVFLAAFLTLQLSTTR